MRINKMLNFLFSLCLLSASSIYAQVPKLPPQGVVNNISPANILISLDTSGSMGSTVRDPVTGYYYTGPGTNMNNAVLAIKNIVTKFSSVARFGLVRWNNNYSYYDSVFLKKTVSYDDSAGPVIPIDSLTQNSNNSIIAAANYYINYKKPGVFWMSGGTDAYARGMGYPKNYFTTGAGKTLVGGNCQKTLIILISDGAWNYGDADRAGATAAALKNTLGITTAVVGIQTNQPPTNSSLYLDYRKVSSKGGGGEPLFAGKPDDMEAAITAKLTTFLAESFTATAPAVMSSVTSGSKIFQPTFEYRANGQWKGYLKAYSLNSAATDANLIWEFGDILTNKTNADTRKLWTVAPGFVPPVGQVYNQSYTNFSPINASQLSSSMSPALAPPLNINGLPELINFIRGVNGASIKDTQDSSKVYPSQRWALGDVYHAKPVYVGPPAQTVSNDANKAGVFGYFYDANPSKYKNFASSWVARQPVLLAASNSGVLHAINPDNGQELWGFVPPPILDKFIYIWPTTTGGAASRSQYLIDGDITVRDIFVNNEWRTYAAFTYGYGARAFTVIDITNTTSPKHVFSIENVMVGGVSTIKRWGADGALTVASSGDPNLGAYAELGYTVSAPIFSFARNSGGVYAPVLILSGGKADEYPSFVGVSPNLRPNTGNKVFIVNLDDVGGAKSGNIVKAIDANNLAGIYANCLGVSCSIPKNQLLTDVEVVEGGRTTRMQKKYGIELFIPNFNGSLQSVDLSSSTPSGINMNAGSLANFNPGASVTINNDRMITSPISISGLTAAKNDQQLNITFGTGNMNDLNLAGKIPYVDNRVYSLQGDEASFFTNLLFADIELANISGLSGSVCSNIVGKKGWMLNINSLSAKDEAGTALPMTYGKVASKVVQYGGSTIFTVYKPRIDGQCSIGDSALFIRDSVCGSDRQSQSFKNTMIGGATVIGDTVVIGISGASGRKDLTQANGKTFTKIDNLILGKGTFDFSSTGVGSVNIYNKQQVR